MTPPDDIRIRIEAAFPGAIVERDHRGDWCITPALPVEIDGLIVRMIHCNNDWRVSEYIIALTPSAMQSVGLGRLLGREVLEQRLQSSSAHDLIAARRRLGL